jgi:hypothetical protein
MVCTEFQIRCRNCVFCSELTLGPQLRVLLQIWDSLLKMSWVQRINMCCRIVCAVANLGFFVEVVLYGANLKFIAKIELFAVN